MQAAESLLDPQNSVLSRDPDVLEESSEYYQCVIGKVGEHCRISIQLYYACFLSDIHDQAYHFRFPDLKPGVIP